MGMSYLVGYGGKYPPFGHHRGAFIPVDAKTGCEDRFKWLKSLDPNPNDAVGALVGRPFLNETYFGSRFTSYENYYVDPSFHVRTLFADDRERNGKKKKNV
ncbi:Glycoside hydrolase family 9 [Dillenia turbinata]|uniref:cellulase n=1 Tax=Dillenia turbinata TaxID=194707 RepID=A0AAN8V3Z1_9MAGN